MNSLEKLKEAKACLKEAQDAGHTYSLDGEWLKWTPPIPMKLAIRMAKVGKEIEQILSKTQTPD